MALNTALSFLGGAAQSGLNFAFSNAAMAKQYEYNRKLQEQQAKLNYKYSQKYHQNMGAWDARFLPEWQRAGLEAAGYNPMLAVQNGVSGSSAGSMSGAAGSSSVQAPDYQGAINSGINTAIDSMRLRNEVQQTEANTDVAYSQADKNKAEKASILEKLPFISQREKAEIANIEKDSMHKESLIHQIDETIRLREKELELQKYGIDMGYKGTVYNADKAYNASTYASDVSENNNIRDILLRGNQIGLPLGIKIHKGGGNEFSPYYMVSRRRYR